MMRRKIALTLTPMLASCSLSISNRNDPNHVTAFAPFLEHGTRFTPPPNRRNRLTHAIKTRCLHRRHGGLGRCDNQRSHLNISKLKMDEPSHLSQTSNVRKSKFDFISSFDLLQKQGNNSEGSVNDEALSSFDGLEDTGPPIAPKRNTVEMATMSAISLTLAISVIYALASSGPEVEPNLLGSGRVEQLGIAARNIADAALPKSADDVIAVSIGEGIAGAIGAVATWILGILLNFRNETDEALMKTLGSGVMSGELSEGAIRMNEKNMDLLISGVVADGDYFLTRAAALPLFEAVGVPTFLASLASVLLATLPYEAIKLTSQKRRDLVADALLMDVLIKEEALRQKNNKLDFVDRVSNSFSEFIQRLEIRQTNDDVVDIESSILEKNLPLAKKTTQVAAEIEEQGKTQNLDYIELFADITKWLEYDVLISNYRGILSINGQGVGSGAESAVFGLLAALSSQLYTDVLYIYSDFGNPAKREKTLNRSLEDWTSVYTTKCLSAATLFGVYETMRAPTSRFLSQLVSGGVGGCVGSNDFDLCMETYLIDNPPAASTKAEIRAFVVSALNWVENLTDAIPLLNDQETFLSFARATIVSLYSLLVRFFSF